MTKKKKVNKAKPLVKVGMEKIPYGEFLRDPPFPSAKRFRGGAEWMSADNRFRIRFKDLSPLPWQLYDGLRYRTYACAEFGRIKKSLREIREKEARSVPVHPKPMREPVVNYTDSEGFTRTGRKPVAPPPQDEVFGPVRATIEAERLRKAREEAGVIQIRAEHGALLDVTVDLCKALARMQTLVTALMPGLKNISVPDYALVNDAPIEAAAALRRAAGLLGPLGRFP